METLTWNQLDPRRQAAALARAPRTCDEAIRQKVTQIVAEVQDRGDQALFEMTERFDNAKLSKLEADAAEIDAAIASLDSKVRDAIDVAYANIQKFHRASIPTDNSIETVPGVVCQTRYVGIDRVGLYAPGGATPLPSSVLMMGVPAQLANCRQRILCTPVNSEGRLDPAIAYAARLCGIKKLFKVGGGQAIAAMAVGTESVPACDKLFGPGSVWVTEAKRQIAASDLAVTIDMPAGPSEVMVLADEQTNARFAAADMIAQIEHGPDSQAILVSTCPVLARQVVVQVAFQASQLSRRELIEASLCNSRVILANGMDEAVSIANRYAAEHLIIQAANPEGLLSAITAAGSIFLGPWTPEVLGDYCSGTNHVLPTSGFARSVNGLSVLDFMKRITVQQATPEGLQQLAATAIDLADWEGLTAHARAVSIRQKVLAEQLPAAKAIAEDAQ